jgi:hypothetical protein
MIDVTIQDKLPAMLQVLVDPTAKSAHQVWCFLFGRKNFRGNAAFVKIVLDEAYGLARVTGRIGRRDADEGREKGNVRISIVVNETDQLVFEGHPGGRCDGE